MKHITSRLYTVLIGLLFAMLMMGMLSACGTEQTKIPQWFPTDVLDGVGQVRLSSDIDSPRHMVAFEEKHTSRAGQVEIAIMLNRLYSKYGLRRLALEGAVLEKEAPNSSWFHKLPDVDTRREVALQLLGQGEISAAEFIAMVYDDFRLCPIERDNEYQVKPSDDASSACIHYLIAIADKILPQEKISTANELISAGNIDEARDIIFGSDPWIKARYDALTSSSRTISVEELINILDEIEAKADQVKADVSDYADALQEAKSFYITADNRSKTMVTNIQLIVPDHPEIPIALNIGSAHSAKVVELLKNQSDSIVVIASLSIDKRNGDLYDIAYDRKLITKSVDAAGALGAFLDGRRKPPPVINEPWLQLKSKLMYATVIIARAARAGGEPPFGLDKTFFDFGDFKIDPSSLGKNSDGHVIFSVWIRATGNTLWILTGQVDPKLEISGETTLEEALLTLLAKLKSEREVKTDQEEQEIENMYTADNPAPIRISRDVLVKVSNEESVIRRGKLL